MKNWLIEKGFIDEDVRVNPDFIRLALCVLFLILVSLYYLFK
jgi:hypothetical protein